MRLRNCLLGALSFLLVLTLSVPIHAEMSDEEVLKELKALQERVKQLEEILQQRTQESRQAQDVEFEKIRSENQRVTGHLKELGKEHQEFRTVLDEVMERVSINGILEVEANYTKLNKKGEGSDEESSDITLATAQLEFDAQIHEYVNAHLILLWEEDESEGLLVDEGTITLGGAENFPFFLVGGRFYPHFGNFDSYFISDPLTLEIGELQESAVAIGYSGPWAYAGIGVFNGDTSTKEDDHLNSMWGNVQFFNPEGSPGAFQFTAGLGYLSNIADTDTFQEEVAVDTLEDLVGGISVFATINVGAFSLAGEYLTTLTEFESGELGFAVLDGEDKSPRPAAWNFELAYQFLERYQVGVKYEGTKDLFALFPEHQYGAVFSCELYPGTIWSIEYLHGEFDDNDDDLDSRDMFTSRLAVEF
jgi:hypothetical protein